MFKEGHKITVVGVFTNNTKTRKKSVESIQFTSYYSSD